MYWGTRKPETWGKNPTFLEPEGFSDFKVLGKITVKIREKNLKNGEKNF